MWQGQCNKCGKCCQYSIHFMPFENEDSKKDILEWANARGYIITQIGKGIVHLLYPFQCPKLKDNLCTIQDNKPKWCSVFPDTIPKFAKRFELDPNLILCEGCGFKWVE